MACNYNVHYEVAATIFMGLLLIYMHLQYNVKVKINREFRALAILMLFADLLDIITAFAIDNGSKIPDGWNLFLTEVYFASNMLVGTQFVRYAITLSGLKKSKSKVMIATWIGLGIYILALVLNPFFGFLCSFRDGVYLHGPVYPVIYIWPYIFVLISTGVALVHAPKLQQTGRKLLMIFYMGFSVAGAFLQYMVFPKTLLALFSVSLGMVFIMFLLETPDYEKLTETLKELEQSKEKAQEATQAAQAANRAKSTFLSHMSHELRTPLNAVMGYNDMIREETKESNIAEYAYHIRSAGRNLVAIISNITDFIELEDATISLADSVYQTRSFISDIITTLYYYNEEKKLELHLSVDPNIPRELKGDSVRLMQVASNLLSNAVKYTEKGYIELSIRWEDGSFVFHLKDTGIGMKDEDVQRLTEAFKRFDEKRNSNRSGLGLGLSIVTRLLAMMGSELKITSIYGLGSEFYFSLKQQVVDHRPIGDIRTDWSPVGDGAERTMEEDGQEEGDYSGRRLLVVDDNCMNLLLMQKLLSDTNMIIDTAENGEIALKKIRSHCYDIIFMDHMMPVMDGMETMLTICSEGLCPNTPVIALTANAVSDVRKEYLSSGFSDYLLKPVSKQELLSCISKYLTKTKAIEESEPETVVEEAEGGNGLMEELNDVVNTEVGLTYCAGSPEFYQEIIQSYLENDKRAELDRAYEAKDWDSYRIHAHSLKSTSLTIGAEKLSEEAKGLEFAVKEDRLDYIPLHHRDVMDMYSELLEKLEHIVSGEKAVEADSGAAESEDTAHIMVIDDDPVSLNVARKMLEDEYRITTIESVHTAIDFLEQAKHNELPALVLLDIRMPEMNGFEVLHWMLGREKLSEIPVIFLTGDEDRDSEIRGFKEGAMDFIRKPFVVDIMKQRIERILQLKTLQKNLQREVKKQTAVAEEKQQAFERLTTQTMEALAKAVDAKDHYTNGHSQRVAKYSREIARRLGKSQDDIDKIYYAGLMHDLGKIGIPDEIIHKDTGLSDEEYERIKEHPTIGANILKNITEIPDIALGAHWHHERIDGSGYPDGLKGNEIPEAARIIGVADAYDAMTSKRSYRDPLPQEVVRRQILEGKGTQFEPAFADVMLQMIDEDKDYHMKQE
jgi:response regulator RpfG family c-di-GMP phosphodiesterase/signal transduction histidine kinase